MLLKLFLFLSVALIVNVSIDRSLTDSLSGVYLSTTSIVDDLLPLIGNVAECIVLHVIKGFNNIYMGLKAFWSGVYLSTTILVDHLPRLIGSVTEHLFIDGFNVFNMGNVAERIVIKVYNIFGMKYTMNDIRWKITRILVFHTPSKYWPLFINENLVDLAGHHYEAIGFPLTIDRSNSHDNDLAARFSDNDLAARFGIGVFFQKVLVKMNTRGQKQKRKSTTKTSSLEAATQEDTPPPMVTTVQDTDANIPSTSGAVMNPVVTNRQGTMSDTWVSSRKYKFPVRLYSDTSRDHWEVRSDVKCPVSVYLELNYQTSMKSLSGFESAALLATFIIAARLMRSFREGKVLNGSYSNIVKVCIKEARYQSSTKIEAVRHCGLCINHNQAIAYCKTCKLYICMPCNNFHKRVWTFMNHNVCPFNKL